MDPYSDDLGNQPLSEIIPQLSQGIKDALVKFRDRPEALEILQRMANFMTEERLGLANTADSDLAAALRLKRLLMAFNALLISLDEVMRLKAPDRTESYLAMTESSLVLVCLVTHGLSTIERIEVAA